VLSVDNLEAADQRLSRGPFAHMTPSPNGKSLALLTMTGILWVISADFQRNLAEFDTTTVVGAESPVRQVEWCGNDAILVTWDTLVLLVGPFGDTLQCVLSWRPLCITKTKLQFFLCRTHLCCHRG
jgi:vacuolar protein sorting-associated protein 16